MTIKSSELNSNYLKFLKHQFHASQLTNIAHHKCQFCIERKWIFDFFNQWAILTILNPDVKNKDFVLKTHLLFHYVTHKKTQSNSKQSQTQLSSAQRNPTPKKKSWAVERRPKRNTIKENPASNSTTTKKKTLHWLPF